MRYTLFILFVACFCNTMSAQESRDSSSRLFRIRNPAEHARAKYLMVTLPKDVSPEILSQKGFQVVRQLSHNTYIIKRIKGIIQEMERAEPVNANWKLSPLLLEKLQTDTFKHKVITTFSVFSTAPLQLIKDLGSLQEPDLKIAYSFPGFLVISTSLEKLVSEILPLESVSFVEWGERQPKEEMALPALDLSTNKINVLHSDLPALNGEGMTVSVKEQKPDTTDIDLKGRYLPGRLSAATVSGHATIMTTMIAGAGNSYHTGKGAAWGSTFTSSSFANLLPDPDASYREYNISVQNHSYGTGIENYYAPDAMAFDNSAINNPLLLHVFSAGNSGTMTSSFGSYAGVPAFANITGSFKMSKNSISVGSVDSFGTVSLLSSRGPAYDGRVKPELVAFGQDGSSGAAAIVSGIALLCQQAYVQQYRQFPQAALIKTILINSADDVAAKGPDFISGYGNVNAFRAVKTVQDGSFISSSLTGNNLQRFPLKFATDIRGLKISIGWSDPAANANAFHALINDLDIELYNLSTNESWKPWVLNSEPFADSLGKMATRNRDSLNNIEQITIEDAPAGNYEIRVTGNNLRGLQPFFIAYQWDQPDYFKWTYPTKKDNLHPGNMAILRWETSINDIGELETSNDAGETWYSVRPSVNLADKQLRLQVADSFYTGRFRMRTTAKIFTSDTFTVSSPLTLSVGFNCADSIQLYWNDTRSKEYVLYRLGKKYLEEVGIYTGHSAVIRKPGEGSRYFAVAPVLANNLRGAKSYTINYTTQGVGCYFASFLADEDRDRARLYLSLSALYNVDVIEVEKMQGGIFRTIKTINPVDSREYMLYDSLLTAGIHTYRIKMRFSDGRITYSEQETVYHFAATDFIVFPNPVGADRLLKILSKDPHETILRCYNMEGRKLFEQRLYETIENIHLPVSAGMYIVEIWKEGKRGYIGKIVVY